MRSNKTQSALMNALSLIIFWCLLLGVSSFSLNAAPRFDITKPNTRCMAKKIDNINDDDVIKTFDKQTQTSINGATQHFARRSAVKSMIAMGVLSLGISSPARADEYGRETEAPTLETGESVMICTKRGPLGACSKTEYRTEANENDKAQKYFQTPTELVKRKDRESRTAEDTEGNVLVERLKKQSEDNFEKNELLVRQRTQLNDASASFGPFDSQVLIQNEDGDGFKLLANPQAMRLKKLGLIENKKFIRQPTQEELDAALEPDSSEANILSRFFGSSEK